MRTLLNLFFVPYLRFLAKFHLVAIPALVLIYILRLEELMVLAPMIYPFALYTTINRHQFKDNIPWMLATFNKRTLIRYHLFSQTLVMGLLAVLSSLVVLSITVATIVLSPKLSDAPARGSNEQVLELFSKASSWMSTKEQVVIVIAAVFFLTTLYSPVSLKDSLRQLEEGAERRKRWAWPMVFAFIGILVAHALGLRAAQFTLPLLAFGAVAQWIYLAEIYNRAFTLFAPRWKKRFYVGGAVATVALSLGLFQLSWWRVYHAASADQRVAEVQFLGAFAPSFNDREMLALLKNVKNPAAAVEVFGRDRQLPQALKAQWLASAEEFGVAVEVLKIFTADDLVLLNDPAAWQVLDRGYRKLQARNPAAAQWRIRALNRQLGKLKWTPQVSDQELRTRTMVEQVVVLGRLQQTERERYQRLISDAQMAREAIDVHLDRVPASETP